MSDATKRPRKQRTPLFQPENALGERIDSALAEKGWTLADACRESGLDSATLSRLRLGDRQPERTGVASAFALADALGVEVRWLFLGTGPRKTSAANVAKAARLVTEAATLLGDQGDR